MAKFAEPEEYYIAGHYLSALINGDHSGFEGTDEQDFDDWLEAAQAGRSGHWGYYSSEAEDENGNPDEDERSKAGEHWRRCEVTGLFALCECVYFMHLLEE